MDKSHIENTIKTAEDRVKVVIGKHLSQIDKQYSTSLQLARFTDLKVVEQMNIITEAGLDKDIDDQSIVLFIDGANQPTESKLFEKFTYLFIKMLDNQVDHKSYTLVYFVGYEVMSAGFTRFREFMKLLPVKYYVRLKQMYVYHASLLVRSKIFFENSKRGKLWKMRTQFIGDLNELFTITSFHKRWVELVPDYLKEEVDMTNLFQLRQESMALSPSKDRNIFSPIFGRELDQYEMNLLGIPLVIDHLLTYFSSQPERLHQTGLFRKCGSLQEEIQLTQLLSVGNYDALKVIDDVNIVADIIKKYFNSLASPLINFCLYNQIVEQLQELEEGQYIEFISIIMEQMTALQRRVLSVMLSFLLNVVEFEDNNKMNLNNIAVVFTPCLMWTQNPSPIDLLNIGSCIKFVTLMLKYYPVIFPNMSYKLFLQIPEISASTSSHSSVGIESQLQSLDEESKDSKSEEESKQQQGYYDQTVNMIELSTFTEELHISMLMKSPPQLYHKDQNEKDPEFSIESILTNVKDGEQFYQQ